MKGKTSESGSAVAWLALALAIVAVVLALVAYYRSGGPPLEQEVAREVQEATTVLRTQISEMEKATAEARDRIERRSLVTEAREALLSARAAIEQRGDPGEIRRSLARAGEDLKAAFAGEGDGARERWQSLRDDLERADGAVGENANDAFEAVSTALARTEREIERVRADEPREEREPGRPPTRR